MAEEAGMVVIADYGNPVAARLAKARLEAEGIKAFLLDENAISVNPFYSPALGGVKLVVAARDADRAREVLGLSGEPLPREARAHRTRGMNTQRMHLSSD